MVSLSSSTKCLASSSASLPRSRKGGKVIGKIARRYSRSSRRWLFFTASQGWRLVAAMILTSLAQLMIAADAIEAAGFQNAQQAHLHLRRHLGDLVQEQSAAAGALEIAAMGAGSTGKGTFLVAEQFGFDQIGRDRAAVDRDERLFRAAAHLVDRAGDQFLSGSAFADHQNCGIGGSDFLDHLIQGLHRFGRAVQQTETLQCGLARSRAADSLR